MRVVDIVAHRVACLFDLCERQGARGWVRLSTQLPTGEIFAVKMRRVNASEFMFLDAEVRAPWGVVPAPDFPDSLPGIEVLR
jgi:hypothetical protein